MSGLEIAWGISLIVTLGTLPPGLVRTYAYRSGEVDHTPAMRTVAIVAMTLGVAGAVCLVVLSLALAW